jgi:hypothetical protein
MSFKRALALSLIILVFFLVIWALIFMGIFLGIYIYSQELAENFSYEAAGVLFLCTCAFSFMVTMIVVLRYRLPGFPKIT